MFLFETLQDWRMHIRYIHSVFSPSAMWAYDQNTDSTEKVEYESAQGKSWLQGLRTLRFTVTPDLAVICLRWQHGLNVTVTPGLFCHN